MTTRFIIVMGVAGSGKTSKSLADPLGWDFYAADDFHPPENVVKMARGVPLNNSDRAHSIIKPARSRSIGQRSGIIAFLKRDDRASLPTLAECSIGAERRTRAFARVDQIRSFGLVTYIRQ
ncbi:MAG TPA: hypothetical protein VMN99_04925, partial [Anaerolineales bacterium]|nr:hypothetical protein [Anaerolineales bacterium]